MRKHKPSGCNHIGINNRMSCRYKESFLSVDTLYITPNNHGLNTSNRNTDNQRMHLILMLGKKAAMRCTLQTDYIIKKSFLTVYFKSNVV